MNALKARRDLGPHHGRHGNGRGAGGTFLPAPSQREARHGKCEHPPSFAHKTKAGALGETPRPFAIR